MSIGLLLIAFAFKFNDLLLPCMLALVVVVFPIYASIYLLNRPRRLVPPPFRDDPGALGEMFRRRRG